MRFLLNFHRVLPFFFAVFFSAAQADDEPAASDYAARLQAVADAATEFAAGAIVVVDAPGFEFRGTSGLADRSANLAMQPDFTLRLGSITKTYVAALSVMAVNEGLLDLDATISSYLSTDVMDRLPPNLDPTVKQLLNHSSGVPDYYGVRFYFFDWSDRGPLTTELVLHAIRGKKKVMEPGEHFSYSNTNYHLAAMILEEVYDSSFGDLLRTKIQNVVGLEETYYGGSLPPGDVIQGYGGVILPWTNTYFWEENTGPDGGAFATADDLVIWLRALFASGGQFASIGQAMQDASLPDGERTRQGMGVEIIRSRTGADVIGHTGGLHGYATAAFYVPSRDATLVIHMNRLHGKGLSATLSGALRVILSMDEVTSD